jgi:hypothetical protein
VAMALRCPRGASGQVRDRRRRPRMITPVDPERNVGERAPRYRGDSSTACLEPERQAVRAVMALRASTQPRAARDDGTCASVRCRSRRHNPFAARSTMGRHGSHRVRGRRVLRGPLGDRRGRGRSAPVIITGALTSCGVALRRDLVARRLARRGQHRRHMPGPTVVRFDAAGVVPNRSGERLVAGAAASSGFRPSREVPNRLRPSPTVPG